MGNEVQIVVTSKNQTKAGFAEVERDAAATGGRAGVGFGEQFTRGADGKLRDSRGRFVKTLGDSVGGDDAVSIGGRFAGKLAEGLIKAGKPISNAIGNVVGTLPPQAQAAVGAGVVAAVAAAAPFAGAALSGALVAAVGGGAVAAGVAAAFQDPQVKAAAQGLADELKPIWAGIGKDFRGPVLDALGQARVDATELGRDLAGALQPAKGYIDPLLDGFTGLIEGVLPGLGDAIREAEPVIDAIAGRLPEVGEAFGGLLSTMAEHADEGADAIGTVLDITTLLVAQTAGWVDVLATAYGWIDKIGNSEWASLATGPLTTFVAALGEAEPKLSSHRKGSEEAARATGEVADAADAAAEEVERLKTEFDRLFGIQMELDEATLEYKEGLAELKAELTDGSRTLDENTEAGRENRQQILDSITDIERMREARIAEGMTIADANALYEQEIAALQRDAEQYGANRGELNKLIGKYKEIPKQVGTQVNLTGTESAIERVKRLQEAVNRLTGKTIRIGVEGGRGGHLENAHGGIIGAAASAATGGARGSLTWVGEQGPELVRLPFGSMVYPAGQSQAMAAQMGGGGQAPVVVQLVSDGTQTSDVLMELFAKAVRVRGGNVQLAVMGRDV